MKKTDILIIGGGPAGMISAMTARRYYPEKKILIMKNVEKGVIPCGIPYMFHSLKNPDENAMGVEPLKKANVGVVIDEAVGIDRAKKRVSAKAGETYLYEKLILALGSLPFLPDIPGIDKEGVFPIFKDVGYLKGLHERIRSSRNVLVLGGGFIGVEFADELSKIDGLNVTLVEIAPRLLVNSFDSEFSELACKRLQANGVTVLTNHAAESFIGKDRVEKVRLSGKVELDADCVILGVGMKPNTALAEASGLDLGKGKGIWVDEYMRTTDKDIFAVGDCAGKRDFFTRRDIPVLLASTATAEARISGANLYKLKLVRENKGTIAVYSTYVSGLVLGSAGLTEESAHAEGFEVAVGRTTGVDKHPKTLPGASRLIVKLIFSKQSGVILGGQVAGGASAGELINIISMAIQERISMTDLETLQMATHPYLTPAPTMYPIVLAAQDALTHV